MQDDGITRHSDVGQVRHGGDIGRQLSIAQHLLLRVLARRESAAKSGSRYTFRA